MEELNAKGGVMGRKLDVLFRDDELKPAVGAQRTKELIERAARLERRKLTDFCVTALLDAARRTIAEHETLTLSERDLQAFFDALVNSPRPSERLVRALAMHQRRIAT